jgi:hypothetical protein
MEKKTYMYRPSDYLVYMKRDDGKFVPIDCSDMEGIRGFDEDLLRSYSFIECDEDDLPTLKKKKTEHYAYLSKMFITGRNAAKAEKINEGREVFYREDDDT